MVFIVFLLINAGVALVFFATRHKHLFPIEILLYWCVSSLLVQNYSAIQTMNLHSSFVPGELSPGLTHFLNRTFLYPVLTLVWMNQYCASRSVRTRWIYLLGFVLLATGIEWLSGVMNVFVHIWWRIPWSAAFWFIQFMLLLGFMKVIRHKLQITEAPSSR